MCLHWQATHPCCCCSQPQPNLSTGWSEPSVGLSQVLTFGMLRTHEGTTCKKRTGMKHTDIAARAICTDASCRNNGGAAGSWVATCGQARASRLSCVCGGNMPLLHDTAHITTAHRPLASWAAAAAAGSCHATALHFVRQAPLCQRDRVLPECA